MIVEIAADVIEGHEVGQRPVGRRLDLTGVLPHHRRDELEIEGRVDVRLGLTGDDFIGLRVEQPVLVEESTAVDGTLAKHDVVGLGAREVHDCRTELFGGDHPDVDLKSLPIEDRGLGVTVADHARCHRMIGDEGHDGDRIGAGDGDVDVANGLRMPSEAPAVLHPLHAWQLFELGNEPPGDRECFGDRRATVLAVEAEAIDCCGDLLLAGLAETGKTPQSFVGDRLLQLIQVLDAELAAHELERLGPDSRDLGEPHEIGGIRLPESVQLVDRAGLDVLQDLVGGRRSNALDLGELRFAHGGDVPALTPDPADCVLVCPDLEALGRLFLEHRQLGELLQRGDDVPGVHHDAKIGPGGPKGGAGDSGHLHAPNQ